MNFVDDTLLAKWLDTKSAKKEETVSWKRITEYEWYFMKMFSHLDNRLQKLIWKHVTSCNMTPGYRLLIYSLIFKIVTRYRHEFKSQELWTEIKFVLERFAEPLTNLFEVSSVVLVHFCGTHCYGSHFNSNEQSECEEQAMNLISIICHLFLLLL